MNVPILPGHAAGHTERRNHTGRREKSVYLGRESTGGTCLRERSADNRTHVFVPPFRMRINKPIDNRL
jgi:hypothetical protein